MLDMKSEKMERTERTLAVVLEHEKKSLGILVDEIIGNQSIVIKPLTGLLEAAKGISGLTILGNGEVSLILDASYLVNLFDYNSMSNSIRN